mgnify:FL=1
MIKPAWKMHLLIAGGLTALSLIFVLLRLPTGPAGEWSEHYAPEPAWAMLVWMAGPVVALVGFAVAMSTVEVEERQAKRLKLLAPWILVLVSFCFLRSAVHLRQAGTASNYFYFTAAVGPGAFTAQAMNIDDLDEYIGRYSKMAEGHWSEFGGTRIISNPPGAIVLLYGCRRLLEAWPWLKDIYAGWLDDSPFLGWEREEYLLRAMTMFVPDVFFFITAFGMVPLWWLAHDLLPKRRVPIATGLAAMIPSLFVFSFAKDSFQMSLALWLWWAIHRSMKSDSSVMAFFSGILLWINLQFSLSFLIVLAVPIFMFAIGWMAADRKFDRQRKILLALGTAGLMAPVLSLWPLGYETWSVLLTAYRGHGQYVKDFGQSYWIWIWLNLFHLLLFIGGPAAGMLIVASVRTLREAFRSKSLKNIDPYFCGLIVLLLLLNFSGKNLSEIPRLWLFLMPALVVTSFRLEGEDGLPAGAGAVLLGLQAIQMCVYVLMFDPLDSHRVLSGTFY